MSETDNTLLTGANNAPRPTDTEGKKPDDAIRPKADPYILGFYILLCIFSVVELYSASSREVVNGNYFSPLFRHLGMLAGGIIIFIISSRLPLRTYVKLTPVITIGSVALMIAALLGGHTINGAVRSITIMGFTIQPSEFLKLSAAMIISFFIARNQEPNGVKMPGIVMSAVVVVLFGGLLFSQGLTNTILLMGISLSMMLVGGIQWRRFFAVIGIYLLVGAPVVAMKLASGPQYSEAEETHIIATGHDFSGKKASIERGKTWKGRLSRYFDTIPKWELDMTAENRQELYSYMAQAHGGIIGVLPGNSRETARLPLAFSDYIYSIFVEEFGLVGGLVLLAIYISLLVRAGIIAGRCDRAFPALLVMGMAIMIVLQALFHMAIVTGAFPVSGQPLPMISQGGTSIFVTSFAFGVMMAMSRYASAAGQRKARSKVQELPADIAAANPTQLPS